MEIQKEKKDVIKTVHGITKIMSSLEQLIESLPLEEEEAANKFQAIHGKWSVLLEDTYVKLEKLM